LLQKLVLHLQAAAPKSAQGNGDLRGRVEVWPTDIFCDGQKNHS
jgi:hypothetical protein